MELPVQRGRTSPTGPHPQSPDFVLLDSIPSLSRSLTPQSPTLWKWFAFCSTIKAVPMGFLEPSEGGRWVRAGPGTVSGFQSWIARGPGPGSPVETGQGCPAQRPIVDFGAESAGPPLCSRACVPLGARSAGGAHRLQLLPPVPLEGVLEMDSPE